MINKFFICEDRVKLWIETNRITWGIMLFFLGLFIGIGSGILFGSTIKYMFLVGVSYGFLLVIVEVTAGGSGTR